MRFIKKVIIIAAVFIIVQPSALRSESKYNLVFLGQRIDTGDIRSISLGGGMQLLDDTLSVLQLNPATIAAVRKVTFGAAQYFTSDRGQSEELTEQDASFKFSSFTFAFPLTNRVTLAVGYRGRYDADGHILTQKQTDIGEEYGEFFNRTGGLTSFPVTGAFRVANALQVGAYYSIEKGSYENRWDIIFADKTKNPAKSLVDRQLNGWGYGAGMVLRPARSFMLGVTYESEIDYDTDVRERHTNPSSNRTYAETTTLPARWTFSAVWRPLRDYAAHGAYSSSDFRDFEGLVFPAERLYQAEVATFGLEYTKGIRIRGMSFPIRTSVLYERLPYDFPAGERITKLVFGFGTGLHWRSGRHRRRPPGQRFEESDLAGLHRCFRQRDLEAQTRNRILNTMKTIIKKIKNGLGYTAFLLAVASLVVALTYSAPVKATDKEKTSDLSNRMKEIPPKEQLAHLRTLLSGGEEEAEVHFFLGNAFYALEDLDSAITHYTRAVELDTAYSKAYVNMGIAFDTKGQQGKARWAYQKALEINPQDVLAYCHLGYNYFNRKNYTEAMENYRRALEIDPNSAQARYNLGLAFANFKLFKEALVEWQKVVELDPDGELGKLAAENVELIKTYIELGE
jgi:tetratricopeptide (TPR) repeat protein